MGGNTSSDKLPISAGVIVELIAASIAGISMASSRLSIVGYVVLGIGIALTLCFFVFKILRQYLPLSLTAFLIGIAFILVAWFDDPCKKLQVPSDECGCVQIADFDQDPFAAGIMQMDGALSNACIIESRGGRLWYTHDLSLENAPQNWRRCSVYAGTNLPIDQLGYLEATIEAIQEYEGERSSSYLQYATVIEGIEFQIKCGIRYLEGSLGPIFAIAAIRQGDTWPEGFVCPGSDDGNGYCELAYDGFNQTEVPTDEPIRVRLGSDANYPGKFYCIVDAKQRERVIDLSAMNLDPDGISSQSVSRRIEADFGPNSSATFAVDDISWCKN